MILCIWWFCILECKLKSVIWRIQWNVTTSNHKTWTKCCHLNANLFNVSIEFQDFGFFCIFMQFIDYFSKRIFGFFWCRTCAFRCEQTDTTFNVKLTDISVKWSSSKSLLLCEALTRNDIKFEKIISFFICWIK